MSDDVAVEFDNDSLVELVRTHPTYLKYKDPRDEKVLEAMRQVDRAEFIPKDRVLEVTDVDPDPLSKIEGCFRASQQQYFGRQDPFALIFFGPKLVNSRTDFRVRARDVAYNDLIIHIGYDQTSSEPSLIGFMCDMLELEKGMKVLEVGSGCGYHAAITAHIIGCPSNLFTVERVPELAEMARTNLRSHFGQGYAQRINIICGDGSLGLPKEAPFDRIYLTAGIDPDNGNFNPKILANQLNPERGILLFPPIRGKLRRQVYEKGKIVEENEYNPVRFVPLVGANA